MFTSFSNKLNFGEMGRIGNDAADESQKCVQNTRLGNHLFTNHQNSDCSMKRPIDLATSQPGVNYKGGMTVASGGCNVDDSSRLLLSGAMLSKAKCKTMLNPRQFNTIPYLGKGEMDLKASQEIRLGEVGTNRKSVNPDSEVNYQPYHMTPMLPTLSNTITNPANMIEGVAAKGWIRGGLPSRDLVRDKSY